jgi:hypothetical protein
MSKRKFTVGSRWVLVSGWIGLFGYGCSTPADETGDGGGGGGFSGSAGAGVSGTFSGSAGTVSGSAGVGVGGTPAGGTAGTPATGGAAPGGAGSGVGGTDAGSAGVAGTPPTGGSGGTPGGGAGPGGAGSSAGGSGGVNTDAACMGIKSNMPCTPEGQMCPNLACGLGDTGRRDCNCATNWTCTSCNFANSPIATKPANADTACAGVTEMAACAMPNDPASVCAMGGEFCICALNPRAPADPPEWDCDDPPSTWP